jgi:uncharacterized repeat protein (TIGR03803 family)
MNKKFYYFTVLTTLCYLLTGYVSVSAREAIQSSTSFVSSPSNNSVNASAPTLKVTANVVTGATRYTIELNTSSDFTGVSLVKTSISDNQRTLVFQGLAYSTVYYARVRTDVSSEYGKITRFTTRAEQFPEVIEPANSLTDVSPVVVRIVVGPIADAKRYTIEINTQPDFGSASRLLTSSTDNENSFIVKNLAYASTYYVRAKADISTKFGPVTKFTTRAMIAQKRLWGLASVGGVYGYGTVFSFSIDSAKFTKHHDYIENNDYPAAYMRGTLASAPEDGFYGNTECEKSGTCGNGEIFYLDSKGNYTLAYSQGIHAGGVTLASNNYLYVVDDWWNLFRGGIMKVKPEGEPDPLSFIFKFGPTSQGRNPRTPLLELMDGYLYGIAPSGGTNNNGVIYRLRLNGTGFQVVYNFNSAVSGASPQGSLTLGDDGYLYGTTSTGGTSLSGTVFKVLPDGSNFTVLHHFSGTDGKQPMNNIVQAANGIWYGMTSAGGALDKGVIFSLQSNGAGFRKMIDFNGSNGSTPLGGLSIQGATLYGMTSQGGGSNLGVIFKVATTGASFTKLFDFTNESGGAPDGSLLLVEDTFTPVAGDLVTKSASSEVWSTVPDKKTINVGVYPNPFLNDFTLRVEDEGQQSVKLIITDLQGNIMSEEVTQTNTDITAGAALTRGMYMLKVIKGNDVSLHRLIKK